MKRGFPITLYGDKGGFVRNEQLVIEWVQHPDDSVDKTLTVPIAIADSSSFTAEFATTELNLGKYKARIYSVAHDGYRSSSIVEAKFAVENPDLAFHGYMSADALTQQRVDNLSVRFVDDATRMHEEVNANTVLFNPTGGPKNNEIPHDYSWNNEPEATYERGMTAFLGISSIFFEPGQTQVKQNGNDCVAKIIDHDGAAETEELQLKAVFYRSIPNDSSKGAIPEGTVVVTSTGERFRTVSDAVFGPQDKEVGVVAIPEDASTRLPDHEISRFSSYVTPNNNVFGSIEVRSGCKSGRSDLDLRSNWQKRWEEFQKANGYLDISEIKAGFYLDEPIWRQITNSELSTFVNAVKNAYPRRPLIVVESGQDRLLDRIVLPEDVDWFGIDNYGLSPSSSAYKKLIDQAQALIAPHSHMKLIIVGDAFRKLNNKEQSEEEERLREGASSRTKLAPEYYDLARFTERAVALGWFAWSLTDDRLPDEEKGMRGLEQLIPYSADPDTDELTLKNIHDDIGMAVLRTGH